jgi:hypothetical protein
MEIFQNKIKDLNTLNILYIVKNTLHIQIE